MIVFPRWSQSNNSPETGSTYLTILEVTKKKLTHRAYLYKLIFWDASGYYLNSPQLDHNYLLF